MKNLFFSLMAIAMFSNANASEIKVNTIKQDTNNTCDLNETNPVRPALVIGLEWGRATRGCNGNGICLVITTRDVSFYQLTTNDAGRVVFKADAKGLEAVRARFGSNTIIVEEAYKLTDDITRALELPAGYSIKPGRYTLASDGNGGFVTTM